MKKTTAFLLALSLFLCVFPAAADYLTIILSPADRVCRVGETVRFEAGAEGVGVRYRWQTRVPGGNWSDTVYPGKDGPVLTVTADGSMDVRQFRCVFTDASGSSAASLPATLTVIRTAAGGDTQEDSGEPDGNSNVQISPAQGSGEDGGAEDAGGEADAPSAGGEAGSVTVMIYLNGADLETEDGAATTDIGEMLDAGVGKNVNVIIETLGTRRWRRYGISPDTAQRWRVSGSSLKLVQDRLGRVSVGETETLSDFISWSAAHYPAERYILILWDHGGGAVYGFGTDEWRGENTDALTMDEIRDALEMNPEVHFDIIGMDACLMGSLEVCLALAPFCDYTVLSEDFESARGWYYTDWLRDLERDPHTDSVQVGKTIVDTMIAANRRTDTESTLALIDESRMDALFEAWQSFAYANESALLSYNYSTAVNSNGRAMHRPGGYNSGYITGTGSSGGDGDEDSLSAYYITDIMAVAASASASGSLDLEEALSEAIVYSETSSSEGLTGLGVTLPYGDSSFYRDLKAIFSSCGISGEYVAWLEKFVDASGSGSYYDYEEWNGSWNGWENWSINRDEDDGREEDSADSNNSNENSGRDDPESGGGNNNVSR